MHRRLDFVHLPVPLERDDEDYHRPLADLKLHSETRLFLGRVHEEDGLDAAQRRGATATRFVTDFGVGAECRMQNEPSEAITRILQIQRDLPVAAQQPRSRPRRPITRAPAGPGAVACRDR